MAEAAAEIFSAASGWRFFLPTSPVSHPKLQGSCGLRYPLLTMHDLNYFRDHLDVFAEMAKKRGIALDLEAFRSEEHTSELQSLAYLVCRLLLEKKKKPQRASILNAITTTHLLQPQIADVLPTPAVAGSLLCYVEPNSSHTICTTLANTSCTRSR